MTTLKTILDRPASHFARHYVEMLVAMFLGMAVLGEPAILALGAAGVSSAELQSDAPAVMLLGMGSHFEIWDAEKLAENESQAVADGMPDVLNNFSF